MVQREIEFRRFVAEYAQELRKHLRVDRIILFGSQARSTAGPDSDIDFLVVSPDVGRSILRDIDILRGCLPEHTMGIDALGCTAEDLSNAEPGSILDEARREGIVLFESDATSAAR